MTLLLDLAPEPGGVGTFLAVGMILSFIGVAFVAFLLLKRSVKMVFRIAIVLIILAIGLAGTVFFYAVGNSQPTRIVRPNRR